MSRTVHGLYSAATSVEARGPAARVRDRPARIYFVLFNVFSHSTRRLGWRVVVLKQTGDEGSAGCSRMVR